MNRANELMKHTPATYVRYLISLPPETPIRLYSYQSEHAWDRAEKMGYWSGDPDYIEGETHDWTNPYRWIRDRMAERIPDFSGDYPMWAWLKRPSTKPKPRRYRGTGENIRLTIMVPRSRILLSDYDSWHSVLNSSFNCLTEREWDSFYERYPVHETLMAPNDRARYFIEVEKSWHSCLEFTTYTDPVIRNWIGDTHRFRVQACVDRFLWDEIISVRRFK